MMQVMSQMSARSRVGIHPPKFVIGRVINQIKSFLSPEPKQNSLYSLLESKVTSSPLNFDTSRTAKCLALLLVRVFIVTLYYISHERC
jgi:hypothetical protein